MIIRLPTCGRPGSTISVGSITHLLFLIKKKNTHLLLLIVDLYMAPEVYKDEIFDRSVDAYSFGLVLYEVHFHKVFIC